MQLPFVTETPCQVQCSTATQHLTFVHACAYTNTCAYICNCMHTCTSICTHKEHTHIHVPCSAAAAYHIGLEPTRRRTQREILLCRSHFSTDTATISPPTKSMLVSLRYACDTWSAVSTPSAGKSTRGSRAVTTMGQASVTQYTATMRMTYAASAACSNGVRGVCVGGGGGGVTQ